MNVSLMGAHGRPSGGEASLGVRRVVYTRWLRCSVCRLRCDVKGRPEQQIYAEIPCLGAPVARFGLRHHWLWSRGEVPTGDGLNGLSKLGGFPLLCGPQSLRSVPRRCASDSSAGSATTGGTEIGFEKILGCIQFVARAHRCS